MAPRSNPIPPARLAEHPGSQTDRSIGLSSVSSIRTKLGAWRVPRAERQNQSLRRAIALLAKTRPLSSPPDLVPEQPFDSHLLALSPLYRRSRSRYLSLGGTFVPALLSSGRSLGSPTLLSSEIHYSPVESELIWTAMDGVERQNAHRAGERILELRAFVTTLFHEQNHRTLWKLLPPSPSDRNGVRRYLNFAESLVITLDMALGDELGPRISSPFYLLGATYDPGTTIRELKVGRRVYRNYLQAALHATYLNLELFAPADIEAGIRALFPGLGGLAERAARRAGRLDRAFVWKTNPSWQRKNWRQVASHPGRACRQPVGRDPKPLVLPADPRDHRLQYLIAERCFEAFGL